MEEEKQTLVLPITLLLAMGTGKAVPVFMPPAKMPAILT